MRVLAVGSLYPPHHFGGYELVWRSAVEHMRDRGESVRVLTADYRVEQSDPGVAEDPDVHRDLRWYWDQHGFPRRSLAERLRLERHNLRVLEAHLQVFDPQLVSWWAMGGMSLSLIERVRRLGLPAVGFVHDEWMRYGPRVDGWQRAVGGRGALTAISEWLTRVPARIDFDRAATWLFNSDAMRERALSQRRLARTGVIRPGIDSGLFRPRQDLAWQGRMLYVGRIDPRKGIDTALRALSLLPGTSLTVVGTGDEGYLAALKSLAHALGIDQRTTFERRARGELAAIYADADVVVFPVTWAEPWGLVPLEAMAVGVPVVATGRGGSSEYLRHEENCILYAPPEDPSELGGAVARLARDEGLRRRLRNGGFETARRFDQASFNEAAARAHEEALA